jgi:hypothetical protein
LFGQTKVFNETLDETRLQNEDAGPHDSQVDDGDKARSAVNVNTLLPIAGYCG